MIAYNKDKTFKISAMNKSERANYHHAVNTIKHHHSYGDSIDRKIIEEYISPIDIMDGYHE